MPREGHGSRNDVRECHAGGQKVMPREGHGSRNPHPAHNSWISASCPARGMGVEILSVQGILWYRCVMPREGHGSRNLRTHRYQSDKIVMPREGHGSRNLFCYLMP